MKAYIKKKLQNRKTQLFVAVLLVVIVGVIVGYKLLTQNDQSQVPDDQEINLSELDAGALEGAEAGRAYLRLAEIQDDNNDKAAFYENSGDKFYMDNHFSEAADSYQKAIEVLTDIGDEEGASRCELKKEQALAAASFEEREIEKEGTPYIPGETEPGE